MFLRSKNIRSTLIYYLLSFAIGGLLGDVFFHTLPHLDSGHKHEHPHAHSHGHDHLLLISHDQHGHSHDPNMMYNNSIIILGIVSFFLIEKIVQNWLGV